MHLDENISLSLRETSSRSLTAKRLVLVGKRATIKHTTPFADFEKMNESYLSSDSSSGAQSSTSLASTATVLFASASSPSPPNSDGGANKCAAGSKDTNKSPALQQRAAAPPSPAVLWEYPTQIPPPSKALLRMLHEAAMQEAANVDIRNGDDYDEDDDAFDQAELHPCGILSGRVLLQAVVCQHEQALKRVQATVQRDHPEVTHQVVAARAALYRASQTALRARKQARAQRVRWEKDREAQWAAARLAQRREALEQKKAQFEEMKRARAEQEEQQRQERRAKDPRNQALWREVAFLMKELHHLEKEERSWKEADQALAEQQEQYTANKNAMEVDDDDNKMTTVLDPSQSVTKELPETLQTVQSLTHSSQRMMQALTMVQDLMQQTEQVRAQVYRQHQNARFHGYPGAREPKDLLRLMSQDDSILG